MYQPLSNSLRQQIQTPVNMPSFLPRRPTHSASAMIYKAKALQRKIVQRNALQRNALQRNALINQGMIGRNLANTGSIDMPHIVTNQNMSKMEFKSTSTDPFLPLKNTKAPSNRYRSKGD